VSSRGLLLVLLEPALLLDGFLASSSLAFNLNGLGLVILQLVGEGGLLW
jgi:hypothetical protein